ncbi:SUR7/PalI family-domain-containing protein [Mariannaea sp. PMI_226]|nr:SUR7/PalI family-domain-containing protein [Mariannaea sp. PMI_226]
MLRPATPLAILLLAAFALLLLSVLSTPIIKAIPLGEYKGVTYGVFGFCKSGAGCTNIGISYDAGQPFNDASGTFDLPSGVRNTLSAILIVHPVAALVTLALFILAVITHLHAPSHSSRFLLVVFIFLFIDFLICLLAFLIDVLLFVPHLAWGSYIVLAATILVALSGIVTCAMRRTLISRKDRQKRIAENAEMSGENYYNRTATQAKEPDYALQPTLPAVSGANASTNDGLPTFASYEQKNDQISDENIPLTRRTTSTRSPIPPGEMGGVEDTFNNDLRRQPSRDQYGNPINDAVGEYGVRRGPSTERMRGRDMGPGGYRGGGGNHDNYNAPARAYGGYGPPSRGGYGPRGGRGGYRPPPRGGYHPGPGGMQTGRSPPPGYPGPYDRRPSPAAPYVAYDGQPSQPANEYTAYRAESTVSSLPRAESPPPLPGTQPATFGGRPIEMDATEVERLNVQDQNNLIRENDSDVAGMIGLQQGRLGPNRHDTYMTDSSKYSNEEQYTAPRAAWNQGGHSGRNSPRAPSPLVVNRPAEPPQSTTPPGGPANNNLNPYYEDVDPQFASRTPPGNLPNQQPTSEPVYEDVRATNTGSRSPAESERSNFTSISQRAVNPRWNPSRPPMPYQQRPAARKPVNRQQQRQDMILDNPDFQLPNSRSKDAPGMVPGSAYPAGHR